MKYRVASEIGQLKQLFVHRPGHEMDRLTPQNKDELLFDDVLWTEQAGKDHDVFVQKLRERGAEPLYVQELLAESLENPECREYVNKETFDECYYGVTGNQYMLDYANSLSAADYAELLIAGITKDELIEKTGDNVSSYFERVDGDFMVLRCLPNHYFARDTSCWVYNGVSINSMQMVARMRETTNFEAIYRWHPRFKDVEFPKWSNGMADGAATIEGGDVEVIGNGAVLVGISQRTTAAGVERLARSLIHGSNGEVREVIGVLMKEERAMMHLDTVMTMINQNTFLKYKHLGMLPSVSITKGDGPGGLNVERFPGDKMHDVIAKALGVPELRILTTPESNHEAERGQWNDACNVLTQEPNVVYVYDRNTVANEYLRSEGIETIEVPSAELGRGRGGPRCMSCPTLREEVEF